MKENKLSIKCFELITGMTIVGEVKPDGTIDYPFQIMSQMTQQGMASMMIPWLLYSNTTNIDMFRDNVLLIPPVDPNKEIVEKYKSQVNMMKVEQSGIILPEHNNITSFR